MLLQFDFAGSVPLYQQLRNQIVVGIARGDLEPGERLPTIRALAEECGINMMTVSKAYQMLKQEGYITTDRRSGAVIAPRPGETAVPRETMEALRLGLSELRLAGMELEEAMELCKKLFEEGSQK